jgi:hypothetical protein
MKCDNYRDALLDAATGDIKDRISAHVEECSQCRATLREERALFAAIDQTLRARMADVPRDGFLADVRARISLQPEPRSLMSPMWILATSTVMVAMLAMVAPWTSLRHEPVDVSGSTLATTHASPETKVAEPKTIEMPQVRVQQGEHRIVGQSAPREPEVLVPPDEREALAKFVMHLRQRDGVAVAFASPAPAAKSEATEIQPLEISRVPLKPLVWERWKPAEDHHGEEER